MIRRLIAIGMSGCIAATAWAKAPQRPQFDTKKVEGTDNSYCYRSGARQSMFIVTSAGVIATDPIGYGQLQASVTHVDEIRKVTDKPIKYLIYSHHHYDHIQGGNAFKQAGATIVAHRNVREHLAPLGDPETPLPDQTVSNRGKQIKLGGTTLELRYMGRHHSDSQLLMYLPKEKIIFVVDTIPVGAVPGRGMIDFYPLEAEQFIKNVLTMDWERLIPGHPGAPNGRLGTKKDAQDQLELLQAASAEMKPMGLSGKCWDEGEKTFKLEKYASWPGYQNGLQFIARRYCGLWGRGT